MSSYVDRGKPTLVRSAQTGSEDPHWHGQKSNTFSIIYISSTKLNKNSPISSKATVPNDLWLNIRNVD